MIRKLLTKQNKPYKFFNNSLIISKLQYHFLIFYEFISKANLGMCCNGFTGFVRGVIRVLF